MTPVSIGETHDHRVATDYEHTAEAFGNPGVRVIGTPALIGFLETAAHRCLEPHLEPGEGTVGTIVEVRHLADALEGATIIATAQVSAVDGRKVGFEVEARNGEMVLMSGRHARAVVDMDQFMAKMTQGKPSSSGGTT